MQWIVGIVVGALVVLGLRSRKRLRSFTGKARKEWCVLTFEEDDSGNIALVDKVSLMRTSEKRKFKWLVVGESRQEYTIKIENFTKDGKTYDLHDLFTSFRLDGDIPTSQDKDPLRLEAKLKAKGEFEKGVYSYAIVVTRKVDASPRLEERGEVEPCPVWPCE